MMAQACDKLRGDEESSYGAIKGIGGREGGRGGSEGGREGGEREKYPRGNVLGASRQQKKEGRTRKKTRRKTGKIWESASMDPS